MARSKAVQLAGDPLALGRYLYRKHIYRRLYVPLNNALREALARVAIETREYVFMNRHGQEILADAAKYDASCASSGAPKRDSRGGKGIGSTTGAGICHSYTPDGRCVSLLKILLTNSCIFDCA